jgi:ubiquinone/menaquinone biosynthesis C-methylase UbiE
MTELTMPNNTARRRYLPAAGRDVFLPFYDVLATLMGADSARSMLINQTELKPNERVLDIGCGTGTFATLIKQLHPGVDVVGLDPDPKALARAQRKARKAGIKLQLDRGFSDALPYQPASFDHVFSTFMFHHLHADQKLPTLREIRRVLKLRGRLHLLDFGGPDEAKGGLLGHLLHSHARLKDNSEETVLSTIRSAGFDGNVIARRSAVFGLAQAVYYEAVSRPTVVAG